MGDSHAVSALARGERIPWHGDTLIVLKLDRLGAGLRVLIAVLDDFKQRGVSSCSIYKRFAGTVYPAMRMRGDADNVVILPEFVDSSLTINQVWYVMVEAADEATSSYTLLTIGHANKFPHANIEWQKMMGADSDHRSHIALEDRHWVWRDGYGHVRHKR
jgi:hypothetical protein